MKKYALIGLVFAVLIGGLYGLHTKAVKDANVNGYTAGAAEATVACIKSIDKAIEREKKSQQKIEYRNARHSDSHLDAKFRAKWVYAEN